MYSKVLVGVINTFLFVFFYIKYFCGYNSVIKMHTSLKKFAPELEFDNRFGDPSAKADNDSTAPWEKATTHTHTHQKFFLNSTFTSLFPYLGQ